ncbi:MAG: hypothetical protein Kow0098_23810 [Ignavibacteriaceae bacterium]
MRTLFSLLSAVIIFLSGCSAREGYQKYNFNEPDIVVNSDIGYLKIYTATYEENEDPNGDFSYKVYKGYTIYTEDGDFVKNVGKAYWEPELIKLNEGEYIIIAELHKNVVHSFKIKIEKGKIIEVDKSMIGNPYSVSQSY